MLLEVRNVLMEVEDAKADAIVFENIGTGVPGLFWSVLEYGGCA